MEHGEVLSHSISLMKQQVKCMWLAMEDQCTEMFFSNVKYGKSQTFVNSLESENGVSGRHGYYYKVLRLIPSLPFCLNF